MVAKARKLGAQITQLNKLISNTARIKKPRRKQRNETKPVTKAHFFLFANDERS